jgi:thiol-disulfide isomerase/thioredoxin
MPEPNSLSRRAILTAIGGLSSIKSALAIDFREDAPKFRAKALSGKTFSNESAMGKTLLIQFWTTWCPYCKRDMSAVDSVLGRFEGKGLVVLGVNVGESKKTVQRYLSSSPRPGEVVLLEDTNLAAVFAAKVFPTYAVIDRDGKLTGTQEGAGGEGRLLRLLRKARLESTGEDIPDAELQSSPRR